jgi:hypothetical protein
VSIPAVIQGRSIRPLLNGSAPVDWPGFIYLQYYVINRFPYYAIRTHNFKLVYFYDPSIADWEFYDLKKDPLEMTNVYKDPAYTKVIAGLKESLIHERKRLGINTELENSIYAESKTNKWGQELNQYNKKMMAKWKGEK